MRKIAKIDKNQPAIVKALREIPGIKVAPIHQIGNGVPDLLIGAAGYNILLEVKIPSGTLTEEEIIWHMNWTGQVVIVRNENDARWAIYKFLEKMAVKIEPVIMLMNNLKGNQNER